jgi:hypothetical protein
MATTDNCTTWLGINSASERKALGQFGKVACPLYSSPLFLPDEVTQKETNMAQTASIDYIKVPKQEYSLLKEVYRTVKRQAFLIRLDEADKNLAAGKTKTVSVDDLKRRVVTQDIENVLRLTSSSKGSWSETVVAWREERL